MNEQTCASEGCRRLAVPSSKHCELHLAKKVSLLKTIGMVGAGIVGVIWWLLGPGRGQKK